MLLSGSSLESSARCAARQGAALPVMQPAARPVFLSIRGHRPQNMQEGGISIRLDKLSRCLDVIILYDFLCCVLGRRFLKFSPGLLKGADTLCMKRLVLLFFSDMDAQLRAALGFCHLLLSRCVGRLVCYP